VRLSLVSGVGVVDVSAGSALVIDQDEAVEYRSVQIAIDDASAGKTIEIRSRTYAETIVGDKNLIVTAPDNTILNGMTVGYFDIAIAIGKCDESGGC
jgi:nitrous oxidase accessory protein NosD